MEQNKDIVIVYGVDTQIGLSLVRELGKKNCEIVAVGKSNDSLGLRSKYVTYPYVLSAKNDQDKVEFLLAIEKQTSARYLLCVSEDDILFFNRVKEQIKPIKALVPNQESIEKVLSKDFTAQAAQKVGIETPKTTLLNHESELAAIVDKLKYPVILKWSNPHDVMKFANELSIKIEKLVYCYNKDELKQKIHSYAPLKQFPMLQEYCPGVGFGQFFFMHEGQALLRFQHQRVHEWPPEGGFSSLCRAIPVHKHEALQQQSIALLQSINWQGVAMVEYRYDETTGNAILMEINGRFWGSLPLAYHANVPFAWYTYKILGLGETPTERLVIADNIQCRNTLVELKRLVRIIFQADKIKDKSLHFSRIETLFAVIQGFFRPSMHYYLFSLDDIRPLFADWKILLKKLIRRA